MIHSLFFAAALQAQEPDPPSLPQEAYAAVGRWDVTVDYPTRKGYAWLEIEPSGRILVGRFVGHGGSARPIAQVHFEKGAYRFDLPRQWERNDLSIQFKLAGEILEGTVRGLDNSERSFRAVRAPDLVRKQAPSWASEAALLNGTSLDGWRTVGRRASQWSVKNGILTNAASGANLVSTEVFDDFRLTAEFRYPKGSNSGIYLRGRYEVQIEDVVGGEPSRHGPGSVYGFLTPFSNAAKVPGEWQTLEITLVGRVVTVVYNGQRIIERQAIPGLTGGALDGDEGKPGPIFIQGDHGPIEFRKLAIARGRP